MFIREEASPLPVPVGLTLNNFNHSRPHDHIPHPKLSFMAGFEVRPGNTLSPRLLASLVHLPEPLTCQRSLH